MDTLLTRKYLYASTSERRKGRVKRSCSKEGVLLMRLKAEQGVSWDDIMRHHICVHVSMMCANESMQKLLNADLSNFKRTRYSIFGAREHARNAQHSDRILDKTVVSPRS